MEPRDYWDRNSVLAEAFCASDERVRHARSVLNEAQAERNRALAAFAVSIGRDATIADLMGLSEREVRLARRRVGRGRARSLAERLLAHATPPLGLRGHPARSTPATPVTTAPQVAEPAPAQTPMQGPAATRPPAAPHPEEPSAAPPPPQVPAPPTTSPATPSAPDPGTGSTVHGTDGVESDEGSGDAPGGAGTTDQGSGAAAEPVVWSSSMDSVLLWSWKSGLNLQTVATELGLDVRTLLLRVQVLADQGLLTPSVPPAPQPGSAARLLPSSAPATARGRAGRHRRHQEAYTAFFSPTTTFPTYTQR